MTADEFLKTKEGYPYKRSLELSKLFPVETQTMVQTTIYFMIDEEIGVKKETVAT